MDAKDKLVDIIKQCNGRLCLGGKWLVWDDSTGASKGTWQVYTHEYRAKRSSLLIDTENLAEALGVLERGE